MAVTRKLVSVTLPAAGDLSTNQFRGVYIDNNGRVAVNTGTATPFIGILMNKPGAIDEGAEVAIRGSIVKMEAGAAINERDAVSGVAGGRGSATTDDLEYVVGRAVTPAAASADLFEIEVAPARINA